MSSIRSIPFLVRIIGVALALIGLIIICATLISIEAIGPYYFMFIVSGIALLLTGLLVVIARVTE